MCGELSLKPRHILRVRQLVSLYLLGWKGTKVETRWEVKGAGKGKEGRWFFFLFLYHRLLPFPSSPEKLSLHGSIVGINQHTCLFRFETTGNQRKKKALILWIKAMITNHFTTRNAALTYARLRITQRNVNAITCTRRLKPDSLGRCALPLPSLIIC